MVLSTEPRKSKMQLEIEREVLIHKLAHLGPEYIGLGDSKRTVQEVVNQREMKRLSQDLRKANLDLFLCFFLFFAF